MNPITEFILAIILYGIYWLFSVEKDTKNETEK